MSKVWVALGWGIDNTLLSMAVFEYSPDEGERSVLERIWEELGVLRIDITEVSTIPKCVPPPANEVYVDWRGCDEDR